MTELFPITKKPNEWINDFEVFPFDVVVPETFKAIIESSVSSKNSKRLLEKIPSRYRSTQSSLAELEDD